MKTDEFGDYEISYDGRTVWVNREALIGRFGPMGIDVHIDGKCAGDGCVPGKTSRFSWYYFKMQMLLHHGIRVEDKYLPDALKDDDPTSRVNTDGALFWKPLEDGYEITVYMMTYGKARVCYGEQDTDRSYGIILDAFCYPNHDVAIEAAKVWDGKGDPPDGWHRNPLTGRRRENEDPTKESVRA